MAAAPTPAYDGKFRAAKAAFKAYVVYFNAHPEARERLGVRPHADYEGKADAAAAVRATRAEARAALNTLTGMWKTLEVSAPPAQLLKALHAMKELHQDGHLNCQDPAMGGEDTAEGRLWGVYRKAAQDLRIDMQVQVPVPAQTLSLAAAEQLEELVRIASLSPANSDAAAPSSSGAPSCSQLELVAAYPNLSEEDPILLTKDDLARLEEGGHLNCTLINYRLRFFQEGLKSLDPEMFERCHFFDSVFSMMLMQTMRADMSAKEREAAYQEIIAPGPAKRWTKHVDLFSKDYIFVPLHLEDQQWSLAVVCRPGLWAQQQTNMTTSRFSNGGRNAVSAPAAAAGAEVSEPAADFSGILYLGPLRLPPSSPGIMKLKWYLEEEYKYKMSHRTAAACSSAEAPPPVGDPRFRIMTVKHVNGAQVNGALRLLDPCDSALYMLKFIEKLATHASALKPPLENSPLFSWDAYEELRFRPEDVRWLRRDMKRDIQLLGEQQAAGEAAAAEATAEAAAAEAAAAEAAAETCLDGR